MKVLNEFSGLMGSVNRQSTGNRPIKAPVRSKRARLVLMLGAAMLCTTPIVAQPSEAGPDGNQPAQSDLGGFTDPSVCATCHKDVVKRFAENAHHKPALVDGGKGVKCENCHGPGNAHAKDGNATLIFNPSTASAQDVDQKCNACHASKDRSFEQSAHSRGNVSCIGCHNIHAPGVPKHLLKVEQTQLCLNCHSDVKPQFSMSSRHKVEEGLIDCTDCHNAHGPPGRKPLISPTSEFVICTKCHMAVAGPFAYKHAAVMAEGCSACHFPHGGPNPKLLVQLDVNKLCRQCHLPPLNSRAERPAVPEHIQSAQSPTCISCHSGIHGSNSSDALLRPAHTTGAR